MMIMYIKELKSTKGRQKKKGRKVRNNLLALLKVTLPTASKNVRDRATKLQYQHQLHHDTNPLRKSCQQKSNNSCEPNDLQELRDRKQFSDGALEIGLFEQDLVQFFRDLDELEN